MKRILLTALITLSLPFVSGVAGKPLSNPHWWNTAVGYEIFVRSFQDSDGDGKGDIQGIINRLPYFSKLGVNALWLTPIFKTPSYHGYDVSDYKSINPDYGSMDTIRELIFKAHQLGLKIILDIPVNHTSTRHKWFQTKHDFYIWRDQPESWSKIKRPLSHWHLLDGEYYYSTFSAGLPDLNWENPEVLAEIQGVFDFWIDQGIDGFRLDAARYLVKGPNGETDTLGTHLIWRQITATAKARHPETYFVGEIWADGATIDSYYGGGKELDAAFNFSIPFVLTQAISSHTTFPVADHLSWLSQSQIPFFKAPFLSSHDTERFATQVESDPFALKLGALLLMTLPGTPFIYYGDEIGMPNGTLIARVVTSDRAKRTPMPWNTEPGFGFTTSEEGPWIPFAPMSAALPVETQQADANSLWSTYHHLIELRQSIPALSLGSIEQVQSTQHGLVSFVRRLENELVLVVLNLGAYDVMDLQSFEVALESSRDQGPAQVIYGSGLQGINYSAGKVNVGIQGLKKLSGLILKI